MTQMKSMDKGALYDDFFKVARSRINVLEQVYIVISW